MPYDIAFTQEPDGSMWLHKVDCTVVRQHRELGRPLAMLYGCEIIPTDTKQCSCMTAGERPEIWSKK